MRSPLHITVAPNGDVQLRLAPQDAQILAEGDGCQLKVFQDRFREKLFVAQMEAACRTEAVR